MPFCLERNSEQSCVFFKNSKIFGNFRILKKHTALAALAEILNKAVCFSKIQKFSEILKFLKHRQLCSEFLSKQNGVRTFFNFFYILEFPKIFENSKSVTCK